MTTTQRLDPPPLGEHTRAVLAELEYDEISIDDLVSVGAIKTGDM